MRPAPANGPVGILLSGPADAACTYLSAVLLAGLVLNTAFGWAWADPITGLVIAGIAVKEGIDAW